MIYRIGLILAAALLICLFPMPYGYYTLIRFASMIIFGCMAFKFYNENKKELCIAASSLALLFQPFLKLEMDKGTWNVVDVIVAIALVLLWHKNKKSS